MTAHLFYRGTCRCAMHVQLEDGGPILRDDGERGDCLPEEDTL